MIVIIQYPVNCHIVVCTKSVLKTKFNLFSYDYHFHLLILSMIEVRYILTDTFLLL